MTSARGPQSHIRALDGLRGLAIFGVVLYHGGHLIGGYLGVDLFFVLSGFLITSLLLAEHHATGSISLSAFWVRRARRLVPALGLVLLGIAAYCIVIAEPTELTRIRGDALATIGYVANWRAIFAGQSYFALFSSPSPLQHTWSLAIEEQFYLLWPLLFVGIATVAKRNVARAVLGVALALGAVSGLLMALLYHHADPNRVYYGTDTRAYALFAGIAVAAIVTIWGHATKPLLRWSLEIGAGTSVVVLGVFWSTLNASSDHLYLGGFALAGAAAGLVCLAAANPTRGPIAVALGLAPLRWLGLISYGLYLWHWPIDVVLTPARAGLTGWPLFGVRTGAAVGIAWVSYEFLEMPIRRGTFRFRKPRVLIPAIAAALVAVIIAATAGATPGVPDLLTQNVLPTRANTLIHNLHLSQTVGPTKPRLLLTGDSIAFTLAGGTPDVPTAPFAVGSAAIIGCGLAAGAILGPKETPKSCHSWPRIWRRAAGIYHPTGILVVPSIWDFWPRRVDRTMQRFPSRSLAENLRHQLDQARTIATETQARLYLLTLPTLHPTGAGDPTVIRVVGEARRVRWLNALYRRYAHNNPGVALLDLGRFIEGNKEMRAFGFADGVHFTRYGASVTWDWIFRTLLAGKA